jgi:lactoylglutathione lyase
MITTISHVACRVRDLDVSLRFYRDVLGLPEAYRLSQPNGDLMLVALFLGGESFLELVPAPPSEGTPAPYHLGYHHLGVWVDDIHATLAQWKATGLRDAPTPQRGIDGVWNCSVRDPEGNPIELWQMTPESLQARAMNA